MGKKHFCFFQTAETGNRTPNSGVKGSGANHYPRAPAQYSHIEEFDIHEFEELLSDIHCPMSLHISLPKINNTLTVTIQYTSNSLPIRPKWKPECKESFIDELQNIDFNHLNNTLDSILLQNTVNQSDIDGVVSEISTFFKLASSAGEMQTREGLKTYNERKRTEHHRPWYTKFCEVVVVVVNHCFTSLFGTKGLLSDIIIR